MIIILGRLQLILHIVFKKNNQTPKHTFLKWQNTEYKKKAVCAPPSLCSVILNGLWQKATQ